MSEYDYASEDLDYGDEVALADDYDYAPPGLPYLENTVGRSVQEGLDVALGPLRALADERAAADAYWQEYSQRTAYEQHVAEHQAFAEAHELADKLAQKAGEQFDARASAADGTIVQWADEYLREAQQQAYNAGRQDWLEQLQSPQGAEAAIAYAALMANNEAIKNRALNIIGGRNT